ncbi:MAG: T9SS type A sorting domain-containing protein [Bacteroidota bacterium]
MKFYISSPNEYKYATDGIGAYFSDTAILTSSFVVLPFTPQVYNPSGNIITDTMNWTKVGGSFIAVGGERYIIIGNFKNDLTTNTSIVNGSGMVQNNGGFYIDDVSVMLCSDTAISVSEINNENFKINLYPNPSNGNILLNYTIKQNGILNIYDVTGKLIEEHELSANRNELQLTTNLNNGIYLYHVIMNDKIMKSGKLVIIK